MAKAQRTILELKSNRDADSVEAVRAEVKQLKEDIAAKTKENRMLLETIESQQGSILRMSDSDPIAHYEEVIADLIERIKIEKDKQAQLEDVSRTISDQIRALQDMHRDSHSSAQKWQNKRTAKADKIELRSVQLERFDIYSFYY